jgi:hypothetical protein
MNTRSVLMVVVLSVAALVWIAAVSLTNTANAVMHEAGQTNSNMTGTNSNNTTITTGEEQGSSNATSTVVRDSIFAYMDGKVLPANDFIHLYDTTPYMIMDGHVAAKFPCNEQSQTPLQILIGQAPNMTAAELQLVTEFSMPGQICMYHADLHSAHEDHQGSAQGRAITDIAIMNPNSTEMQFPVTSTVVIGINEIMPLEEGHVMEGGEGTEIGEEEHMH